MKFKKIFTTGLAAVLAVSAMSISAFAEGTTNRRIIAQIPTESGKSIVYEDDLLKGPVSVQSGKYEITISIGESNGFSTIMPFASGGSFLTGRTTPYTAKSNPTQITESATTVNFSNAKGVTPCSPDYYTPDSSHTVLRYSFTPSTAVSGGVTATVHYENDTNDPLIIDLYSSQVNVTIRGMSTGDLTYATIYNRSYKGTATGTCAMSAGNQ